MQYSQIDPFTGNVIDGVTEDLPISRYLYKSDSRLGKKVKENQENTCGTELGNQVAIDISRDIIGDDLVHQDTRLVLSWSEVSYYVDPGDVQGKKKARDANQFIDESESVPFALETSTTDLALHKQRQILYNVHGQVRPGEMVAILGSSGAGKTTLLNILAGRVTTGTIQGRILVNGKRRGKNWKHMTAYVEQEDVLYKALTVRETVTYAARLRLPSSISSKDKIARAEKVLQTLGITECADTRIGGCEFSRGISGGEKKRTAIAVELVTSPRLLFLDEPTSGLDAYTALSIIETLSEIAINEEKTVIMTIHQPREDILSLFTKILLVSQGRTIYYGPPENALAYFNSLGYRCPPYVNPADFYIDLLSVDRTSEESTVLTQHKLDKLGEEWRTCQQAEIERRRFVKGWRKQSLPEQTAVVYREYRRKSVTDAESKNKLKVIMGKIFAEDDSRLFKDRNWWISEYLILLQRDFKEEMRQPIVLIGTLVQTLFLLILVSFTFFQLPLTQPGIQARAGVLYFVSVSFMFATASPIFSIFPVSRNVIIRERYSGSYRVSAAYISKATAIFPYRLFQTALFCLSFYYIVGLNPLASRYFIFLGISVVVMIFSQAIGLFIAAASPDAEVANIVGPLILTVFLIYGGYIANITIIPIVLRWIIYISPIFFAYLSSFQNEFTGLQFVCYNNEPPPNGSSTCIPGFATGEQVISFYGLESPPSIVAAMFITLGFAIFYHFAAYIALRITSKPKIKLI